jgi:hypothetical protein
MTSCEVVPLFKESHAGLRTCPRDWVPASHHSPQVQYHDKLKKVYLYSQNTMLACVPALVIGYLLHLIPPRYSTMTNCEGVPLFTESMLCYVPALVIGYLLHLIPPRYSTMTNWKGVPLFTESMLAYVPVLVIGYLLHLISPRYSTMTYCTKVPINRISVRYHK